MSKRCFACAEAKKREKQQIRIGGQALNLQKRATGIKREGFVLVHSCISGGGAGLDPFDVSRCKCKKQVSPEEASRLVGAGSAVDFRFRNAIFTGGPIILSSKHLRAPRSQTIEKAHIERLVGERDLDLQRVKQLQAALDGDKFWRERERIESERADIYQQLTIEALNIRQIPAEEYDAMVRNDFWVGRALFNRDAFQDERGSIGVDVLRSPVEIEAEEETEAKEVEPEEMEADSPRNLSVLSSELSEAVQR